jgi:hypothetical protein
MSGSGVGPDGHAAYSEADKVADRIGLRTSHEATVRHVGKAPFTAGVGRSARHAAPPWRGARAPQ